MQHPTDPLALKLMIVGRRRPGTTLAEHRHHIRHVHGELVRGYIAAEPQNAPQRYVQNPVFDGFFGCAAAGDPFALNRDFVTQIWMQDFAALGRSRQTKHYLEKLQGDEDNFVDQASVVFLPVRERERLSRAAPRPNGFKLFGFLRKARGADAAAFAAAWAGAAALADGPQAATLRRHVQNEVLPGPGGSGPPLDGIDEFWLDDEAGARDLLARWRAWVNSALVVPGLVVDESAFALLANEAVLHAGPR